MRDDRTLFLSVFRDDMPERGLFVPKTEFGIILRDLATRLMVILCMADAFIGRDLRDDIRLPEYERLSAPFTGRRGNHDYRHNDGVLFRKGSSSRRRVNGPDPAPGGTNQPACPGMSVPASIGVGHHAPEDSFLGNTGTGFH
ncbi:MAG TPA: hypothetical protein VJ805_04380 [Nitrospiraceae bacterium]|nr:hypothetical protein [Nitrospiraceae bacterium]